MSKLMKADIRIQEQSMTDIEKVLSSLKNGDIDIKEAEEKLGTAVISDLTHTRVDNLRKSIKGYPEVIYAAGKTAQQLVEIAKSMKDENNVLFTRIDRKKADAVSEKNRAEYFENASILLLNPQKCENPKGNILVCCGGTSDLPVAEEAAITALAMGNRVTRLYDVGVAGIHRLLENVDVIRSAKVIVACAGMEGALPSVIAGLTDKPVIAVPTSVGYGASFNGLAALLGMLNSCSSGVSVVNIDNGFGAGYQASLINHLGE